MGYIARWVTAWMWSMHRLTSFVGAKDFNILITHLKVSVIMPIDPTHQKNAFSRDNMEQGENAPSLKVKWLRHVCELEPESAPAEQQCQSPAGHPICWHCLFLSKNQTHFSRSVMSSRPSPWVSDWEKLFLWNTHSLQHQTKTLLQWACATRNLLLAISTRQHRRLRLKCWSCLYAWSGPYLQIAAVCLPVSSLQTPRDPLLSGVQKWPQLLYNSWESAKHTGTADTLCAGDTTHKLAWWGLIYTPACVQQLEFAQGTGMGECWKYWRVKCFWKKTGSASPSLMNLWKHIWKKCWVLFTV